MTIPDSSDAELEDKGRGGVQNSRGGGDGVDLYDAELLLPGEVPGHDMPATKIQNFNNAKERVFFYIFLFRAKYLNFWLGGQFP